MLARWVWMGALVAGCASGPRTPLSLDVHYSADAQKLMQSESLKNVRVGVARFVDRRPRANDDIHAASYVAHDAAYHVGMTWNGRTFAPAAAVIQGLLVEELKHAGLNAVAVDADVDPDDLPGAQAAGQRDHDDVVLGGVVSRFAYNQPDAPQAKPTVALEVTLYDIEGKKALLHAPLDESHPGDNSAPRQKRIDALLSKSFRPVAHDLVGKVADELSSLVANRAAAAAMAAAEAQAQQQQQQQTPPEEAPPPPPAAHAASLHRHKRGRRH